MTDALFLVCLFFPAEASLCGRFERVVRLSKNIYHRFPDTPGGQKYSDGTWNNSSGFSGSATHLPGFVDVIANCGSRVVEARSMSRFVNIYKCSCSLIDKNDCALPHTSF